MNAELTEKVQGVEWRLETLRIDGSERALPAEAAATLQLQEDDSVNGVAFINRFFGKVEVAPDGGLTWGDAFGTTKMAGPPELMELEQIYLSALPMGESMRLEAGQLILESQDGTVRLQFQAVQESGQ